MFEVAMVDDGAVRGHLRLDAEMVRRVTSVEPRTISIHQRMRPERLRVEAYLEAAYDEAFQGRISRHFPTLMSVQDADGVIHAAVGFRLACAESLFLERYLDAPVEVAASAALGEEIDRLGVVEIGNLASTGAGASLFLFLALAGHLHDKGATHAVATATRQLRRSFARVGFATAQLTRADPSRLGDAAAEWGAYYQRDPAVLVGAIGPALEPLGRLLARAPAADDMRPWLHPDHRVGDRP
jgi:Thermostable hemolysin